MTILTTLKRTTALAAIVTLPLAPAAVLAESAQATGTQPPAVQAEADSKTSQQGSAAQGATAVKESGEGAKSGEAKQAETGGAQQGQGTAMQHAVQAGQQSTAENVEEEQPDGTAQAGTGGASSQPGGEQPANEVGTRGVEGQEGTQSGEAPDQAATGDQTGAQTRAPTGDQTGAQTGAPTGDQTGAQTADQTGEQQGQQETGQAADQQARSAEDPDALVAKVGDSEIRRSDVLGVISMLPAELQQQPPEMLIPIALDQLVMRELILQEAKSEGMENDSAVTSLSEGTPEREKEDAMVQAWLAKELGDAVSEDKVQQTYETVKQQMGDQAPDVETLRPQIEQELRQQAFVDLSRDLQEGAEITLYGPDGEAVSQ